MATYDIYVMDINGRNTRLLTNNSVTDRMPAWSPDGAWIVFSSDTRGDGGHDLYKIRPDGSGLTLLYSNGERNSHPRWSPDGKIIVFTGGSSSDGATWEIERLDVATNEVDLADQQHGQGLVADVRAGRRADLPDRRRRSFRDCAHEHRRGEQPHPLRRRGLRVGRKLQPIGRFDHVQFGCERARRNLSDERRWQRK